MNKRLTSLLLAACMMLPLSVTAWATESTQIEGEEDVTLQPSDGTYSRQYSAASDGTLIVTLDPGHGGKDSGATQKWNGKTAMEKEMNLKIGLACREELSKYAGVKVYMTRDDDTYLGLSDRVKYAQSVHSDLMVSLHINSADSSSAQGELVIVPNGNYRPALLTESKKTASRILSNLEGLGLKNRGYLQRNSTDNTYPDGSKADYYSIIRNATMVNIPSMIVEHAFISNSADYTNYLASDAKLKQMGQADAKAIVAAYNLKLKSSNSAAAKGDAPFDDVYTTDWYYAPVVFAYQHGLMTGTAESQFSPSDTLTRAMAVQTLYNYSGKPQTTGNARFADVAQDSWYYQAVTWAAENGITTGTSETTFSPDGPITREQFVALIYRFKNGQPTQCSLDAFTDAADVSDWAVDAVTWAVQNGIISGSKMDDGTLMLLPASGATRAETAMILEHMVENIK